MTDDRSDYVRCKLCGRKYFYAAMDMMAAQCAATHTADELSSIVDNEPLHVAVGRR